MRNAIKQVRMQFCLGLCCGMLFAVSARAAVQANSATFRTDDGVTLHYLDAGAAQAQALVLIPGWTMPADIFAPQINELSKHFRVVALDPRSQGESEKTAEGNTLERHAKDIDELLEHLKLSNVVLLGWSNGVPDVLTYAERQGTGKLRGLVLVDSFIDFGGAQIQKGLGGMLKSFQADRAKFVDGFVRNMYATKQSEEYIAHVKEESLKTPTNTAVVEMFNVINHGDLTPILAKLDKPVLFICEAQLESQAKVLKTARPDARVEVFQNVGHALFVDDAERFDRVVTDFIDTLAPAKN